MMVSMKTGLYSLDRIVLIAIYAGSTLYLAWLIVFWYNEYFNSSGLLAYMLPSYVYIPLVQCTCQW